MEIGFFAGSKIMMSGLKPKLGIKDGCVNVQANVHLGGHWTGGCMDTSGSCHEDRINFAAQEVLLFPFC